ncbi:MAG: hypothetical protein ACK5O8_03400 [Pirellula sp.]
MAAVSSLAPIRDRNVGLLDRVSSLLCFSMAYYHFLLDDDVSWYTSPRRFTLLASA